MKKFTLFLLILYLIIPVSVFAYSDYVIASGQNIGIELKSDNPIIVGSYNIGNYNILTDSDLKIGDKLQGTVRNVVDFGLFIDVGLKNDGLAHISKLTREYIKNPSDLFSVGDIVDCYVEGIDLDKKKVNLSLIG